MTKLILRLERLVDAVASEGAPADAPARDVVDLGDGQRAAIASTPLSRWIAAAAAAHDPCLVLDAEGRVLSISTSAAELLGCTDSGVIGRALLDVVDVVDFDSGQSEPDYAARIAPLAVLATGSGLMRSLMRVRRRDGLRMTVDTASAPVHDATGATSGSFSFLASVGS